MRGQIAKRQYTSLLCPNAVNDTNRNPQTAYECSAGRTLGTNVHLKRGVLAGAGGKTGDGCGDHGVGDGASQSLKVPHNLSQNVQP